MHKHNFIVMNEFSTDSQAEQLCSMGLRPNTWTSFSKKYITDFKCTICNKMIRKIVKS